MADRLIEHLWDFMDYTDERIDSICFSQTFPGLPAGMERTIIGIDDDRITDLLHHEFGKEGGPGHADDIPPFTAWSPNYAAIWTQHDGGRLSWVPSRPAAPRQRKHGHFDH